MEALDSNLGDTVLAPELVPLWTILSVAVGHNVSAVFAPDNEDLPHLVMRHLSLMLLNLLVFRI